MTRVVHASRRTAAILVERPSPWEWAQAALLGINLVWTTLCLGGYRPETMQVTLALTGVLLVVHCIGRAARTPDVPTGQAGPWLLIPFLAYALINVVFVSPVPWLGWLDWLGWANLIAIFSVVVNGVRSGVPRRMLFFVLVALGITAVALACYQRFVNAGWLPLGREQVDQFLNRASGPFGVPNSLASFLILLLPATGALALRRHAPATERVWWGWVTLVFGLGLGLTASRGGGIALALALVVWPFCMRQWTGRRRALTLAGVFATVLTAGALLHQTSPVVRDRVGQLVRDAGESSRPILWRAAWSIFRDNPFLGSGAGSFNVHFEQHRPARFVDEPQWAHNEYLNTLSDYGVVGLLLLLAAAGVLVRRRWIDNTTVGGGDVGFDAALRRGAGIGVLAFALHLLVDFQLKIPALAMTLAVMAAIALGRSARTPATPSWLSARATRAVMLIAAGAVMIMLIPVLRFHRAEALRYNARQWIDRMTSRPGADNGFGPLDQAEDDLRRATELAPRHAGAWSDLAYALELRAWADPAQVTALAVPAVAAAERATALAPLVPEFWIRLGVALDMHGSYLAAESAFEKSLKLAPRNAQVWYYYAYHISLDTERRAQALRAIATGLSLDPGNGAAEALRVKLNERMPVAPFIP